MLVRNLLVLSLCGLYAPSLSGQAINVLGTGGEAAAGQGGWGIPAGLGGALGKEAQAGALAGFRRWTPGLSFITAEANYGTATELDSEGEFGMFMLNPGSGGKGLHVEGNRMIRKDSSLGGYGRVGAAWFEFEGISSYSDGDSLIFFDLRLPGMVGYASAGVVIASPEDRDGENTYQLGAELGATVRGLGGDMGQDGRFLRNNVSSDRTLYWGPELTLFVRLNQLIVSARGSYFAPEDEVRHVSGLTGFQGFIGVRVLSSFFSNGPESAEEDQADR